MRTFGCRPCATTVALTVAPLTSGAPTFRSAPVPTANTWSNTTSCPTSAVICSTLTLSPTATLYCLPPVRMTAYIQCLTLEPAPHREPSEAGEYNRTFATILICSPAPTKATAAGRAHGKGPEQGGSYNPPLNWKRHSA